jgi:hypothetical protein
MKIEAVTVSINFSDYLREIVRNKSLLDRWLIITHKDDKDTINLCKSFKLEYMLTKKIYENNAQFAKGKAINEGLQCLDRDDWILHLDSDILLPQNFRKYLNNISLDTHTMYWTDRYRKDGSRVHRSVSALGFFQLWHSSETKVYPEQSHNAGYDDLLHRDFFENDKSRKLKKLFITCTDVSGVHGKFHNGRNLKIS